MKFLYQLYFVKKMDGQIDRYSILGMFRNQMFTMNLGVRKVEKSVEVAKIVTIINQDVPKKEMKWAGPTWLILHTLAEKVDESRFLEVRVGLLNTIYTICTLLPCPICATHAKKFLDGVNFDTIQNKEDLKRLLFEFHNLVSKEKNLPIFNYDNINMYETTVTIKVIQNFMHFFSKKSGSIRLISDDLHRTRTIVTMKTWFNENMKYFRP